MLGTLLEHKGQRNMDGYRAVNTERQQQSLFTLQYVLDTPNRRGRILSQDSLELFARI